MSSHLEHSFVLPRLNLNLCDPYRVWYLYIPITDLTGCSDNVARRACRFGNDPVHGGAASPDEWAAIEKKRKEQLKKLNEEQQTTPPMLPMLSAAERQSGLGSI